MANVREPATCASCGRPLPTQHGRGRQRRYCDATCRSAARRDRVRTADQQHVNASLTKPVRKGSVDNVTGDSAVVVDQVLAQAERFGRDWADPEPLVAVASARRLAHAVDDALRTAVERARNTGRTWQEIGDLLGTSRQAAFQRFGRPIDPRTGEPMQQVELVSGAAERAVALFVAYVEQRYDDLRRDFDDRMLATVDETKLIDTWTNVAGMFGAYEGMGEPFVRPIARMTVVDVPLRFEAGDMVGRVAFHSDGKVGGFFVMRPEFA
ncbi:MAG TPA: DUF3887 domain-containing protein [Pseudonocardiaceae bacterium]|nr:DUF3887 domain-containing protein [Pseudonocardiaceae bacterium]